ncbi:MULTISPECIES: SpoIIE family protein phosphatase [Actinoplanes]|uniref:SpoIIE family protein phosphatase n=1 Tax=Actinoplanes TaxID=1865 RepID=UPI0005F2FAB6|nr:MULTISPECIES: SpoIIE family protein phosphatase [Actinoplanes]GLY00077.1 hypothetical protein Acsp01_04560 [Actinoplanes sp. NBRC 101535]
MTVVIAPGLLQAVLDASTEATVVCSASGEVLFTNETARALLPDLPPVLTGASFHGEHIQGFRRRLDDDHYAWFLRDHTDEAERTAALEVERSRSAFLAEAGRRLSASLHIRRCVRTTVELAAGHLADAAMVILPSVRRQSAWTRFVPGRPVEEGTLHERMLEEVPGLTEALGGFPPIPSRWLDPAQAPEWLFPADLGPVGGLLVTPLPGNAEPAGALILVRRTPFTTDDEALARVFAARAGAAIAAAVLYREQVDTTEVLQADLLPPVLPDTEGFELTGSYQAARDTLRIGGDFFDVFEPLTDGGPTALALGDVCGTGPEAAVLTGKVRQTLRALHLVGTDPVDMLRVLNTALMSGGRARRFVTVVTGAVTRIDHGRVRLDLAAGGHPAPLVLRGDGTVEEVPTSGTLIGVLRDVRVQPATVELAAGELCLLYSDGLTEARGGPSGGEQFGEHRLRRALAECSGMPGTVAVERLRQLVSDWTHGGARDDIAMLAVRAPARPHLSLRDGGASDTSPYLISARQNDRRSRNRS